MCWRNPRTLCNWDTKHPKEAAEIRSSALLICCTLLVELWYACYPDGYIASSLHDADDIQIPKGVKLITTWWIFFVLASLLAFALGFSLRRSTSNPVLTMNGSILFGCLYVLDTAVCALGSLIVIRILQSDFGISKARRATW